MRQVFKTSIFLLILSAVMLIGCKKDDIFKPDPRPVKSNELQLVVGSLPGEGSTGIKDLYAVISISNSQTNEEVLINKKLALEYNGKYVTEKITLTDGHYKLTKFLLQETTNTTRFASPVAGSAKSAGVQKPLSIEFSLPKATRLELPVEVAKVEGTDNAQAFGYPSGTFNQLPSNGEPFIKIKVKAVFGIGDIVYDSIPAMLVVNTWNDDEFSTKTILLAAGANEVSLSRTATKYELKLQKWGATDQVTLQRSQVEEGTLYSLGGNRVPKKLQQEDDYLLIEGAFAPKGRTIYTYKSDGLIEKVNFYEKRPEYSELKISFTDWYSYAGTRVKKIDRKDENDQPVGFTEFVYGAGNKVVNMHRKSYDQHTYAAVDYSYPPGQSLINITYLYDNGNSMVYRMKIKGGNKVEDNALSSTGGTEAGSYAYDFHVNPYAHMNMPNIYLSNLSKNNLIDQQKSFGNNIPSGVPYRWEYKYDNEGYPTELLRYFKSHVTGEHLYIVKTVYTY